MVRTRSTRSRCWATTSRFPMASGPAARTARACRWAWAVRPSRLLGSPLVALKSVDDAPSRSRAFIGVVGHGPLLEREDGALATLRQLGATVRALDLWDDPLNLLRDDDSERGIKPRALVFEALDRPDLG